MHTAVSWLSFRITGRTGAAVRYCNSSMAASTFFCVLSVTAAVPANTRETVAILTPATRATSFIVDKRPPPFRYTECTAIVLYMPYYIHAVQSLSIAIASCFQNVKCKFT